MLISRYELGRQKKAEFAWWRMIAWVLLLVAGFGCLQYLHHAQQLWSAMQALPAGDSDIEKAHNMLAWDAGYFIAAFAVIVASAGSILRQAWARPVLRVFSLLLAAWLAARAALAWKEWHTLTNVSALVAAMGHSAPVQNEQVQHLQNIALIGACIGTLAVIVLLWLAWQLGQPAVRLQFRARVY